MNHKSPNSPNKPETFKKFPKEGDAETCGKRSLEFDGSPRERPRNRSLAGLSAHVQFFLIVPYSCLGSHGASACRRTSATRCCTKAVLRGREASLEGCFAGLEVGLCSQPVEAKICANPTRIQTPWHLFPSLPCICPSRKQVTEEEVRCGSAGSTKKIRAKGAGFLGRIKGSRKRHSHVKELFPEAPLIRRCPGQPLSAGQTHDSRGVRTILTTFTLCYTIIPTLASPLQSLSLKVTRVHILTLSLDLHERSDEPNL